MKLDLEALNIFVQIVESGSISGAAQRLDMPVSAVSRSLSRLEQHLGLTLLQRSTRRMEITDEGRLLLAQAHKILDEVRLTEERLALRRAQIGGVLRRAVLRQISGRGQDADGGVAEQARVHGGILQAADA